MAGLVRTISRPLRLDGDKLAVLLALRRRLALRAFTRQPGKIIGLLVALLIFAPLSLGVAVGTAIGYLKLPEPFPGELLGLVAAALWLLWLALPIFAFQVNEGLDLSRLMVYPVRPRELLASALLGSVFDLATWLALPVLAAVLVGWARTPALLAALPAVALLLGHMLIIGQLALAAGSGLLRSRRFRDIGLVVMSLLGSSCYFLNRAVGEAVGNIGIERLSSLRPLLALQWLPPGAAARAIERAAAGEWPIALLWLLYCAALLAGLAALWWRLAARRVTGAALFPPRPAPPQAATRPATRSGTQPARRVQPAPAGRAGAWAALLSTLPPAMRAIFVKELKALVRLPQRRIGLIQGFLAPLLFAGFILLDRDSGDGFFSPWLALGLPALALLNGWTAGLNMLGWEGPALPTLLSTPVPRRYIFLGKGLAHALMAAAPVAAYGLALAAAMRSSLMAAGLVAGLGVTGAVAAVTMAASVFFPYPQKVESASRQSSFGSGGCLSSLGNLLLTPLALALVSSPTGLLLALAVLQQNELFAWAGAALALPLGAALYWFGAAWAGRLLLGREAEIIEATRLQEQ